MDWSTAFVEEALEMFEVGGGGFGEETQAEGLCDG
jgi:hypothetical protein